MAHGDSCLLISMSLCNPHLLSVDWTYWLTSNTDNAAKPSTSLPRLSDKHSGFCFGLLTLSGAACPGEAAACCEAVQQFAGAFVTKYHELVALTRDIYFLTVWEVYVQDQSVGGLFPSEVSLVSLVGLLKTGTLAEACSLSMEISGWMKMNTRNSWLQKRQFLFPPKV